MIPSIILGPKYNKPKYGKHLGLSKRRIYFIRDFCGGIPARLTNKVKPTSIQNFLYLLSICSSFQNDNQKLSILTFLALIIYTSAFVTWLHHATICNASGLAMHQLNTYILDGLTLKSTIRSKRPIKQSKESTRDDFVLAASSLNPCKLGRRHTRRV